MNRRTFIAAAIVLACTSVASLRVHAAILNTDAAAFLKGTQPFSFASITSFSFIANVDYAVYAPGAFSTSDASHLNFPSDPSLGTQYVYAYQMHNVGTSGMAGLNELSVGLDEVFNTQAQNHTWTLTFGTDPDGPPASTLIYNALPVPTSAKWKFNTTPVALTGDSEILYFTSPIPPRFVNSTVKAVPGTGNQQLLPSPIPEPLAGSALVGFLMIGVSSRRRRF